MKLIRSLLIFSGVLLSVACGNNDQTTGVRSNGNVPSPPAVASPVVSPFATPQKADELASARLLFARNCAICHGGKGQGGPVPESNKGLIAPSLREGHALHHSDEEIIKQIENGEKGEMPAFKDKLRSQEIAELVRFIRVELQNGSATKASSPKTQAN